MRNLGKVPNTQKHSVNTGSQGKTKQQQQKKQNKGLKSPMR